MSSAEDVPSPKDFRKWSEKIAGYWLELGTELGVPDDRLTNININTQLYPTHEKRAFQMLKTWKEQGGASYWKMADALRELGKVELANSIFLPMEDNSHTGARKETEQTLTPGNKEAMQQPNIPFVRTADLRNVADAVCQIETRDRQLGTGFYATVNVDGLAVHQGIFTNNHVIPSSTEAQHATFNFGYEDEVDKRGHQIQLKPLIFRTDEHLDYSFIGVDVDQLPDVQPIKFEKETDVNPGDKAIHIIQHPRGRPQEFTHGEITEVNRPFVHYNVNTEGGSSGSPVLKNMKVIAIHHHGVKGRSNWGTLCSAVINHLTNGEYSGPPNPTNTVPPLWLPGNFPGSSVEKTETPKNGSSADRHDRAPTHHDLLLVQSVGNKYEELGLFLGVPRDVLQDIKYDTSLQTPGKKALKMLQEYCNRDEAPSCLKLVEGLRIENVGRGDLAKKLLEQL